MCKEAESTKRVPRPSDPSRADKRWVSPNGTEADGWSGVEKYLANKYLGVGAECMKTFMLKGFRIWGPGIDPLCSKGDWENLLQ